MSAKTSIPRSMRSFIAASIAAPLLGACGSSGDDLRAPGPPGDASSSAETSVPDARMDGSVGQESGADGGVLTVKLSGCSAFSYQAPVAVGSQSFDLVLDTGSTTLAVASTSCTDCTGISPEYKPAETAVDDHATASSIYGSGADTGPGWTGEIYQDTASVGGTHAATTTMRLVAIDTQNQFFVPEECSSGTVAWQGIVGFAPAADAITGTDGYFDRLVLGGAIANVFATQLCEPGGFLWLGGYDPAHVTGPPAYTPLLTTGDGVAAYLVDLEQVVTEGMTAQVHAGSYVESLIDTGSNQFFLPPAAFATVTAAIEGNAAFKALFGSNGPSFFTGQSCVTLAPTKSELDEMLPGLTLTFGANAAISIAATATESYLVPVGGGSWCTGMEASAPGPDFPFAADLGAPVLRSNVVVFDRAHARVGFAPHGACP